MPDIRTLYEKDFLGQWDVADEDLVLTIKGVAQEDLVQPSSNKTKKKVCLTFNETDKKMVLNATNRDTIAKELKLGYDHTKWLGHRIQLYKDPKIRFGREEVGGLRIRKFSPDTTEQVFCEECGGEIKSAYGMTPKQIAATTKAKYGLILCAECGKKHKEAANDAKQG